MRIGAHLSISKGLANAAEMAIAVGADTFGFHSRNPRGSGVRAIPASEIAAWKEIQERTGLGPLVGHLPYIINLGSASPLWDFGCRVVSEDLVRCDAFGAYALVLHPGHRVAQERDAGIQRVADGIRAIMAASDGCQTRLLLEGMAGQTGELGATPEELGQILEAAGWPDRVGVCLDSCHLFAAGWDMQSQAGVDQMLAAFDGSVGAERIGALHLNDSKFPRGSHKDRHELLGQGEIGEQGIAAVVSHPRLQALPMIIETPVADYTVYAGEIATARRLSGTE